MRVTVFVWREEDVYELQDPKIAIVEVKT